MSLSNLYPTIAPSLNLDFANVKALDPRITFARTTTATYYDGVTIAKAEENLLLQSQDFSTTWVGDGTTITTNTQTAPDGTSTADVLVNTAATEAHYVRQAFAFVAGQTYTLSCFIKKGTVQYVALVAYVNSSNNAGAGFDLDAPSATAGGTGTGYSATNATITSVGNSWYRCSVEVTIGTTVATTFRIWNRNSAYTSGNFFNSYAGLTSDETYLWGAQLEQRSAVSSYTPTTTQPITNYIPVLQTAASGVARFDHNPTTGESLGLLVEEQRTNLQVYSQEFDNAAWLKTNSSIISNTIVAPDGTLTGDRLVEDTATGEHSVGDAFSFTSGTTYTGTIYAKKAERTLVRIGAGNPATWNAAAVFDLASGVATSVTGGTATIQSVGNGWYRISVTGEALATASTNFAVRLVSTGTTINYTGNGYSGIYIWGAQLEAGAFPTSYIATTSASVTRNADAASMTGTNFSSWFNNAEGTVYCEIVKTSSNVGGAFDINGGSTANSIRLTPNNSIQYYRINTNSVEQTGFNIAASSNGCKGVIAYKANDIAASVNGGSVSADSSAYLPVTDRLLLGSYASAGANLLNGTIKKLAFYPSRLSDAQLVALTS